MKLLALHLEKYIDYAQLRGMTMDAMVNGTDLEPMVKAAAGETPETVGPEDFRTVICRIASYLKDEKLGIKVGNHLNLNTLGVIYRISLKSVTVEEALYFCQSYLLETLPLVRIQNKVEKGQTIITYSLEEELPASGRDSAVSGPGSGVSCRSSGVSGPGSAVSGRSLPISGRSLLTEKADQPERGAGGDEAMEPGAMKEEIDRIVLETILTVVYREMNLLIGEGAEITIYSPYCDASYPQVWEKGGTYSIRLAAEYLKAGQKNNSHWGLETLIPEYLGLLESLKATDDPGNKVKRAMLQLARPELPDIDSVASLFNLTARTLQRQLAAEGINFRKLSETLKKQLCSLLIRHERYSTADIALLLGYADAPSFIHSFQKWHGCSPGQYKAFLVAQQEQGRVLDSGL